MPSRWLGASIVVFWLAMTGWLFWRDLWPNWRPGQPPPFYIDPVDEVNGPTPMKIYWTVLRRTPKEDKLTPVFSASTWVQHDREEDAFTLHAELDAMKSRRTPPFRVAGAFRVDRMTSAYRVTRSGRLLSLDASLTTTLDLKSELKGLLISLFRERPAPPQQTAIDAYGVKMSVSGTVRGDQFFASCRAESPSLDKPLQFDLPPTILSPTASVLLPLHPVNRIRGLRPGQSWRQPLVDPLRDALASFPGFSGGVRSLQALVLPRPETLPMGDGETQCLVIEYRDDEHNLVGRTLVEVDSERVQQQEAHLEDGLWIMRRELAEHNGWKGDLRRGQPR